MTIEIVTYNQWHLDVVDIYVVDRLLDSRRVLAPGGGEWLEVPQLPEGDQIKPTLRLPSDAMMALADALDKLGVKTDSDAKLKGTIEAMRLHLDDMRILAGVKTFPAGARVITDRE